MVQVAVTNLVNKGKLTAKEYGKSAIYWADQGAYQDVSGKQSGCCCHYLFGF